jgi:hypothetical protein
MIILSQTTDKIQINLGGSVTTNQLNCFVSYRDTTTTTITPGRNVVNTNNTTLVDLVGSPAPSTQRVVEYISVYNNDTTSDTITINFYDNGTSYELIKTTLLVGEKLEYQSGVGFKCFDRFGSLKNSVLYQTMNLQSNFSSTTITNDVINNNAVANTIADITGLSFPVTANKTYYFKFIIIYISAATATGSRFTINGPSITRLNFMVKIPNAGTTTTVSQSLTAYDTPATAGTTSPVASATIGMVGEIEGILVPSANGTLIGRFASEVANSAITVKSGSTVYYRQLD